MNVELKLPRLTKAWENEQQTTDAGAAAGSNEMDVSAESD